MNATTRAAQRRWRYSVAAVCLVVLVVIGWGFVLRVLTT